MADNPEKHPRKIKLTKPTQKIHPYWLLDTKKH